MRLIAPLPELEGTAVAVAAARPSLNTHGVNLLGAIQGGALRPRWGILTILGDASADTIASPTGGALGVEKWSYRKDKAGVLRWMLVGYLNAGVSLPIIASSAVSFLLDIIDMAGDRFALAGTGAHAQTYWVTPVEEHAK